MLIGANLTPTNMRATRGLLICSMLWNEPVTSTPKDRLSLLRSWVQKNGNASACEAAVILEKQHSSTYKKDKELLKVAEMVKRGFSELLGFWT